MQAQLSNIMFQMLQDNIGEEVLCLSFENGQIVEYQGILQSVFPFNGITVDSDFIKFVSEEQIIHEVTHRKTSKKIYFNTDTLSFSQEEINSSGKLK